MKINERLNLVIPIYGEGDDPVAYVHSMPLSRSAFEANYRLISAAFAALYGEGLGELVGPRVAALVLNDVAEARKADAAPLLNEIKRLSCFIRPGATGWEQIPLSEAIAKKQIDDDDVAEVMSAIVFFTVASATLQRHRAKNVLEGAAKLWGADISSLLPTELIASLPTLTAIVASGVTAQPAPSAGTIVTVNG